MSPILKINLGVLVLLLSLATVSGLGVARENYASVGPMMYDCLIVIGLIFINLVLALITSLQKNPNYKYYLLNIGLILLIGIPACLGTPYMYQLIGK